MHTLERKGWNVNECAVAPGLAAFPDEQNTSRLEESGGLAVPVQPFGRSPRPGKWKNLKELSEEDVKGLKDV